MKTVTLYNSLGQIMGTASCSDPDLLGPDHGDLQAIDGAFGTEYYVDAGQPVKKPQDPSTDQIKYQFDYVTKIWQLDNQLTEQAQRDLRNALLADIDQVSSVRYASLTSEQQAELQAYRQALLDVPQQAGFPTQVEWPAKPIWL